MYDLNVASTYGPQTVRLGLPPASLLKFPPSELPITIPAPDVAEPTWKQPFNIPPTLYNQLLDVRVPITVASVYAVTVMILNRVNKSRDYKPYAFSHTKLFKLLVILHNVFLALYSAWTFAGMVLAFSGSLPGRGDPNGLVALTDALCKINGPRGYGNAATYNTTTDQWSLRNPAFKLADGIPDPADNSRLWNKGLAYFGWIFYISKFYEVVDTAIILAKGKKSSTLQTYHHAGAMMSIHAMMYTYYTVTALRIRVPTAIKRSLTTMQITQFVFGSSMAASYLFVSYTLPYTEKSQLSTTLPAAATAVQAVPFLKQIFGFAGESASKNTQKTASQISGISNQMNTCLDTTGQGFAVWLNVMYLLPLTYLFVRFFVRSYLYRKEPSTQRQTPMHAAEKAGLDALKGVSREIQKSVEMNGEASETATDDEAIAKAQAHQAKVHNQNASNGSPVKTRSATANQKKSAANGVKASESAGFSPVPSKKGAKRSAKEKSVEPPPSVPEAKGQNPFEVLDGKP
ncbi:fatty acid elongase [Aspergillus sclerotialis]|uniref:Elongation of fatty acids protein n=1 Tax=Aspergillus sclerotialis TaxID=2070753 RepID=A0A3A2ZF54_9EURO|nr:fatty acid elongase [Aspergillus sclerotialis]